MTVATLSSRIREADESGYTLVQLLVSSLLTVIVVTGALSMVDSVQAAWDRTRPVLESQQMGRIAMERMTRDLHKTGVGIAWLLPPLPLVVPRADGGIEIRHNETGLNRILVSDMANTGSDIAVGDVTGFLPGERIAVFDADGSLDLITITDIDTTNDRLRHAGVSKAYRTADGAAVSRIGSLAYYPETVAGVTNLMLSVNGGTPLAVATNVETFTITYMDDSVPPAPFVPADETEMLRIEAIEITLELRATSVSLGTPAIIRYDARITPRGLVLS